MATIPEMFYLSRMPRFLATLLALQTLSAFAAHHRVSPPASIQTAINTAKAGDTIELGPGIWRELTRFSSNACLLVPASAHYDEADYIRELPDFQRLVDSGELS